MSNLGGSSRVVSILTLGSRCTGLLRDAVFARSFGVGGAADIFFLAFQIPNLFRRLFGEGALSAAFLPMYAERHQKDRPAAARFAAAGISAGIGLLTVLIALLEMVLFSLHPEGEHPALAVELLRIVLPYAPMVCLVALLGAVLQVRGRFAPTAAAPAILNVALVVGVLTGPDGDPQARMHCAAWAVLVAGVLQVAWSLAVLGDQPFAKPNRDAWDEAKLLAKRAVPVGMGLSVLQVNILTDTLLASWPALFGATSFGFAYPLEEGANTHFHLLHGCIISFGVFDRCRHCCFPTAESDQRPSLSSKTPSNCTGHGSLWACQHLLASAWWPPQWFGRSLRADCSRVTCQEYLLVVAYGPVFGP